MSLLRVIIGKRVSPDYSIVLLDSQFRRVKMLGFFLFQCRAPAFHLGVVLAFSNPGHGLNGVHLSERFPVFAARVQASEISVNYRAAFYVKLFVSLRYGSYAKLFLHVRIHYK